MIVVCLFSPTLFSQRVELNEKGEKVVRFSDGSWRYYEVADSVYELSLTPAAVELPNQKDLDNSSGINNQTLEGEMQNNKREQPNIVKNTDRLKKEIYDLREERKRVNQRLIKETDPAKIAILQTELQDIIRKEQQAEEQYQKSLLSEKGISLEIPKEVSSKNRYSVNRRLLPKEKYRSIQPECLCTSRIDAISKVKTTSTEEQLLLSYTPAALKAYVKEQDYIKMTVGISHIQGRYYLNLSINLASPKGQQTYGYLQKGSQLILSLLHSEAITLYSSYNDLGQVDAQKGMTNYQMIYPIDIRDVKRLQEQSLDMIRVVWSTGYEDYQVYRIDAIKDQILCLQKNL